MPQQSADARLAMQSGAVSQVLALACAVLSQAWLCVWLSLRVEPAASANPRLAALGPAWSLAIVAGVVSLLVAAALVMRTAIQPRLAPGARRSHRVVAALAGAAGAVGLAALLGGPCAVVAAMVAVGAVFYVLVARFIPPVGIITFALLVTLTAAIPNPRLSLGLPLALTLLHATLAGTAHHHIANLRPKLAPADWVGIGAGWVFWTLGLVVLATARSDLRGAAAGGAAPVVPPWIGPAVVFALFVALMVWSLRRQGPGSADQWTGVAALALVVYSVAWLASYAMWVAAAAGAVPALGCVPACVGRRGNKDTVTPARRLPSSAAH